MKSFLENIDTILQKCDSKTESVFLKIETSIPRDTNIPRIDNSKLELSKLDNLKKKIFRSVDRLDKAIALLFDDTRKEQINQVFKNDEAFREIEKKLEKNKINFIVSLANFGIALGTVYYPILIPLSIVSILYNTKDIHKKTFDLALKCKVSVETLTSIIVIVCITSNFIVIGTFCAIFYNVSAFLLIKAEGLSQEGIINVFKEIPAFTWQVQNEVQIKTPVDKLEVDDIIAVHTGEVIPIDGIVVKGSASVDEHILTGESQPVEKEIGSEVFSPTSIMSGSIHIQVKKTGKETVIAEIGNILNKSSNFRTDKELRIEKLTNQTVLPTLLVAGASLPFLGWYSSIAILNAHFKYRLNAIAPVSILNYLNVLSQKKILVKQGKTMDFLSEIDTVVFDKTGTLTKEQPSIGKIYTNGRYSENKILLYAATTEQKLNHPIAKAIVHEAAIQNINLLDIDETEYEIGYGISVVIARKTVQLGSLRFMEKLGIPIPPKFIKIQSDCYAQANSLVWVAIDRRLEGAIELHASIRDEAKQVICELKKRGIQSIYIVSGDHEIPTQKLAQKLEIDDYFAEVLPQDKGKIIEKLKDEGKFVCYIGDGINDSIALKNAHVAVSLGDASSIAQDSAQIILMDGNLFSLITLLEIGKDFKKNIDRCFTLLLVPTILGIGGVFVFQFGLAYTMIISQIGFASSIGNAMLPLVKYQDNITKEDS